MIKDRYLADLSEGQATAWPKVQESLGLSDDEVTERFDRHGNRFGWAVYSDMLQASNDLWLISHQDDLASGQAMRWLTDLVEKALQNQDTLDLLGRKILEKAVDKAADAAVDPLNTKVKDVSPSINALKKVLAPVLKDEYNARQQKRESDLLGDNDDVAVVQAQIEAQHAANGNDAWSATE